MEHCQIFGEGLALQACFENSLSMVKRDAGKVQPQARQRYSADMVQQSMAGHEPAHRQGLRPCTCCRAHSEAIARVSRSDCRFWQVPDSQKDVGENHAVSGLKFRILRRFLDLGYAVLLSDVDIVTLQNPFKFLARDCDVESMSDGWDNATAYGELFQLPGMDCHTNDVLW